MAKKLVFTLLILALWHHCFAGEPMVHVYRWYNPQDKAYTVAAENALSDSLLITSGWSDKTYMYDAYTQPGNGRVAVYSWVNTDGKQPVSIPDGEYTDEQMYKRGYSGKNLQFYLATM